MFSRFVDLVYQLCFGCVSPVYSSGIMVLFRKCFTVCRPVITVVFLMCFVGL